MTVGPVQMLVLGFASPDFRGRIIEEVDRLRAADMVRVIDSLIVFKTATGDVEVVSASNLKDEEESELGGYVASLLGLDQPADGDGPEAEGGPDIDEGPVDAEELWDVIEDIPPDTAAAIVLLDHQWAVPLRDAIQDAGGFLISEGFIPPVDLAEIGL